MRLRFNNTLEDLVAFTRDFHQRSPFLKRQALTMALVMFVLSFSVVWLVMSSAEHDDEPTWFWAMRAAITFVLSLTGAIAIYFVWKPYMVWNVGRTVRTLYRLNPDKVALGERELEVVGSELVERNDYGEFRWRLDAIERITHTPDYVFIRLSSMRAYILPRDAFSEAALDEFLAELAHAHRQPPPLPSQELPPVVTPADAPAAPAEAIRRDPTQKVL